MLLHRKMPVRGMYLIGMLVVLFLANIAMLMGMTNWPQRTREGFAAKIMREGMDNIPPYTGLQWSSQSLEQGSQFAATKHEGFMDYLSNGFATAPIGSYDGVNMAANLQGDGQGFRARMPNVPHPTVVIDNDHLLPFVNNACKPECCGATMSCDGGGCVCTTPEDRDLINTRGGNRLRDDGF